MSDTPTPESSPEPPAATTTWRDLAPWEGTPTRGDKALLAALVIIPVVMVLLLPVRPLLIASHPIVLEFLTGSYAAIGAAAAFARVGEAPLWLVIVAGLVGMIKFDWLFWLIGRRWGQRIIQHFAPTERTKRFAARAGELKPGLVRLLVVAAALPGVPAALVMAVAGLSRMRLITFVIFDALGAAIMVGLLVGLGYALGQEAVDVVLWVDKYALWFTVAIIVAISFWSSLKAQRRAAGRRQ